VDNWQVNSHASRLGFKGEEDLGNGLSATFKVEYEVNPDSDNENTVDVPGFGEVSDGGTAGIKRRNQYVGLKGGFGEVRVGRHDTPLKMAQGKFDQFNDTDADIKGKLRISQGENRVDNAIAYLGKSGDLKFGIALVPGEGDGVTGGDGPADTISAAVMYSAGPAFVSLAIDQYDDTGAAAGDTDGLTRLVGTYKMGKMQFGLLFEQESQKGGGATSEKDVMGLSFGMGMGKNKAKFQYMTGDVDQGPETTQMTVGYDIGLSKRTTAYVLYTDGDIESAGGATTNELSEFSLGMIHKF
jgi:predicted porin